MFIFNSVLLSICYRITFGFLACLVFCIYWFIFCYPSYFFIVMFHMPHLLFCPSILSIFVSWFWTAIWLPHSTMLFFSLYMQFCTTRKFLLLSLLVCFWRREKFCICLSISVLYLLAMLFFLFLFLIDFSFNHFNFHHEVITMYFCASFNLYIFLLLRSAIM